jgi:hypothetical protein
MSQQQSPPFLLMKDYAVTEDGSGDFIVYNRANNTVLFKMTSAGAITYTGNQTIAGNVLPSVDDTYNLGSTALRWGEVFAVNLAIYAAASDANPVVLINEQTNGGAIQLGVGGATALDCIIQRAGVNIIDFGTATIQNMAAIIFDNAVAATIAESFNVIGMEVTASNYLNISTHNAANTATVERLRINAGAAQGSSSIESFEPLILMNIPAFQASDKYLVVSATGNVHVSALGPAS